MLLSYQLAAFGQPLVKVERDEPKPQGAEILVQVKACGVCHSDIHIWDGYFDLGNDKKILAADGGKLLPLTLGHEIAGTVVALGPEARGAALGDERVIFPWIGCGACQPCRNGREEICTGRPGALGIFANGGYASHVLVPDARYLLDFAPIPAELACTYACSGLTAYGALKKVGRLKDDEPLLIVGAGGVGLNGIRLARAVTGRAPIVADIDPAKRAAALAAGAADAIDPAAEGALKSLLRASGGIAGAVDFAGTPSSFNFAQSSLRKGGHVVLVGLIGGSVTMALPLIIMRALRISGSYVGSLGEMRELLDLARREHVQSIPLESRPLDQANQALMDLKGGKVVGRVILRP